MTPLNAFVGHSFTENDATVVKTFLQYLDQLSEIHPSFTWHHAEHAEPKIVSEKVLRLLEGKNLFIAICTKKERAVSPNALAQSYFFFARKRLQAKEEDFSWKTSDWIIQEIGLAIGLKLHVVLLVEEGVRPPGSIQGDLEHINFDRNAPEKSFGKLLEMISALSPKTELIASTEAESKSSPSKVREVPLPQTGDTWTTIQPGWKRHEFEFAYLHFVVKDDKEGASTLSESYLATDLAVPEIEQKSWDAFKEYIHLLFGKGGDFGRLLTLSEENPTCRDISNYLGIIYEEYDEHEKAAVAFQNAAQTPKDSLDELKLMSEAALAYQKANKSEAAVTIVDAMRAKAIRINGGEVALLTTERKIAEISKDDIVMVCAMERLLELDPCNKDTRFDLAYKYSNLGDDDLATLHYSRIPAQERSAVTWNNLGVSFDQLGLNSKSVVAYRKSEELGETLAMSNLANKLIQAGFLAEAQNICDAALALKDYHKNIGSTLGMLKEIPGEEEKTEVEVFAKATPKSDFYKKLGCAVAEPTPTVLFKQWQGKDCLLELVLADSKFSLAGTYEKRHLGLLGIAGGLRESTNKNDDTPVRYQILYKGVVRGGALIGTVTRKRIEEAKAVSLLGSGDDGHTVLMFLSADQTEIQVLEKAERDNPQFYSLKCQQRKRV
ncbi:MAG: hypothetical protein Q7W05_05700 [Deltaproteobacteria bacterium]|nr:hypothetical protein [Deltaproteobacteria bacterium]